MTDSSDCVNGFNIVLRDSFQARNYNEQEELEQWKQGIDFWNCDMCKCNKKDLQTLGIIDSL